MQYIRKLECYQEQKQTAVTLGKFDGLHRGHQKLVDRVKAHASEAVASVVFAFDMTPLYERLGREKKSLMTGRERYEHLEGQTDYLIDCPFTEEISSMEAETFIKEVLVKKLHAAYIAVGTDFHFGHEKRGDIHMLRQYADLYGYELEVVEKELYQGREISSTYIKEEVRAGRMETAECLLGYAYAISGVVEHGRKLGRKLGIPTMNITPEPGKLAPPNGVYACRVRIGEDWYSGIGNLGNKPTVDADGKLILEVHVFSFDGETYGEEIKVELLSFVRPERRFVSVEELKSQMEADIATIRNR